MVKQEAQKRGKTDKKSKESPSLECTLQRPLKLTQWWHQEYVPHHTHRVQPTWPRGGGFSCWGIVSKHIPALRKAADYRAQQLSKVWKHEQCQLKPTTCYIQHTQLKTLQYTKGCRPQTSSSDWGSLASPYQWQKWWPQAKMTGWGPSTSSSARGFY